MNLIYKVHCRPFRHNRQPHQCILSSGFLQAHLPDRAWLPTRNADVTVTSTPTRGVTASQRALPRFEAPRRSALNGRHVRALLRSPPPDGPRSIPSIISSTYNPLSLSLPPLQAIGSNDDGTCYRVCTTGNDYCIIHGIVRNGIFYY